MVPETLRSYKGFKVGDTVKLTSLITLIANSRTGAALEETRKALGLDAKIIDVSEAVETNSFEPMCLLRFDKDIFGLADGTYPTSTARITAVMSTDTWAFVADLELIPEARPLVPRIGLLQRLK